MSDHLQELLPNDQEQHCRNNRGDPAVHDSAVLRGTFHEAVHDFLSGTYAPTNVLAQHRLCGGCNPVIVLLLPFIVLRRLKCFKR